mmetsp:Transcript_47243/g.107100  ORF Transcript_47243/g.107100 Transcript_47243/m.107100 type:complete len:212 (-) Transcript_47243:422-1057(-)
MLLQKAPAHHPPPAALNCERRHVLPPLLGLELLAVPPLGLDRCSRHRRATVLARTVGRKDAGKLPLQKPGGLLPPSRLPSQLRRSLRQGSRQSPREPPPHQPLNGAGCFWRHQLQAEIRHRVGLAPHTGRYLRHPGPALFHIFGYQRKIDASHKSLENRTLTLGNKSTLHQLSVKADYLQRLVLHFPRSLTCQPGPLPSRSISQEGPPVDH